MSTNQERDEVVNQKRLWMTGDEFKAKIEAHEAACREKAGLPKKPDEPRRIAREFVLDYNLKYTPKIKGPAVAKQEVKP